MNDYLDHHNENYRGIEAYYTGEDPNDYEFEKALRQLENC